MGEVATQWLQLRQRLLAFQSGEPQRWQTLHHLEKAREAMVSYCSPRPPLATSQATTVNVLARTSAVCFPPFGTFGHCLLQCLWSGALRGCICSECCPEPGPLGRIRIRCRPTSRCCPATKNKGNIRTVAAWMKIKTR